MVYQTELIIDTHGEGDVVNITGDVQREIQNCGVDSGITSLFVVGSTAAITTIEYEKGVLSDLSRALSVISPDDQPYAHDMAWGDGNGRSHVKAALVGPSLSVPLRNGKLLSGTWQQIVLLELDVRTHRRRTVVVTITS